MSGLDGIISIVANSVDGCANDLFKKAHLGRDQVLVEVATSTYQARAANYKAIITVSPSTSSNRFAQQQQQHHTHAPSRRGTRAREMSIPRWPS